MTDGRFTHLVAQFILTTIRHDKSGLNLHLLENSLYQWSSPDVPSVNVFCNVGPELGTFNDGCLLSDRQLCVFQASVIWELACLAYSCPTLCLVYRRGYQNLCVLLFYELSAVFLTEQPQFLCCLRAFQIAVCCKFLFQLETAYFFKCVFLKVDNFLNFLV